MFLVNSWNYDCSHIKRDLAFKCPNSIFLRHALDTDSKKWRLFADLVNDAAMFLELLLLPMFPEYPTHVLCLTTSMKGIVGVAGGAARASITQHHVSHFTSTPFLSFLGSQ